MRLVVTGNYRTDVTVPIHIMAQEFKNQVTITPNISELMKNMTLPPLKTPQSMKSYLRAKFHLQKEIEEIYQEKEPGKLLICDHGTLDCYEQWPGTKKEFFEEVYSSIEKELSRYDWVIQITDNTAQDYLWSLHPHLIKIPEGRGFIKCMKDISLTIGNILSEHATI
jgi:hypothetical protein